MPCANALVTELDTKFTMLKDIRHVGNNCVTDLLTFQNMANETKGVKSN
jgi:hypothetical protein